VRFGAPFRTKKSASSYFNNQLADDMS